MGITPESCIIKNPIKTPRSYNIIHKAEKQLLYKRIRNINNNLYMYELKRSECYSQLRSLIQDDRNISQCILPINKIKEFRHNKTRPRQKEKFNRLISKMNGYLYNHNFGTFGRHMSFWQTQGFWQTPQLQNYIW